MNEITVKLPKEIILILKSKPLEKGANKIERIVKMSEIQRVRNRES
jgi:hypothetical protein